jgi:hypothetical protein
MTRLIRISLLMLGLAGTYAAAAIPQVPARDGGPIPLCVPNDPKCIPQMPPLI